jgi:hypothetical protein
MNAYLDNNIASGIVRDDLGDTEMIAVRRIQAADERGQLKIVTSSETGREQDRTSDPAVRAQLQQKRDKLELVTEDHLMLGNRALYDNRGMFYGNSPILTEMVNPALFASFKNAGLKDADARHLMYAVHNKCDRFITTDPDFINRRTQLEALGGSIRIQKPSELVTELGLIAPGLL